MSLDYHSQYIQKKRDQKYQELMNKEMLTQEDFEFCKYHNPNEAWLYLTYIGPDYHTGQPRYLNTNIYSEKEKEDYDLRREIGI